jgi:hypothetical protein
MMAERKQQSQKQSATGQIGSARKRVVARTKTSAAGAWKAAALDRYLTVRPGDTDAGAASRVIR